MLTFYLGLLIAGAVLLLIPLLGPAGDAQLEDAEAGPQHDDGAEGGLAWLPFHSLRFWTFATTFGGLAGAVLTSVGVSTAGAAVAATVVGFLSGAGVCAGVTSLGRKSATGSYSEDDFIGAQGVVLLPLKAWGEAGRVRIRVARRDVDRPAITEDPRALAAGEGVVVWRVLTDGTVAVTTSETQVAHRVI